MKRYIARVGVLLLAAMLISCGGGGGGDDSTGSGTTPTATTGGSPVTPSGGSPGTPSGGNPPAGNPPTAGNPPSGGTPPSDGTPPSGGNPPPPPSDGNPPPPPSGGNPPPPPTGGNPPPPPSGGGTTPPSTTTRFEESDTTAVTLSAGWTPSDPHAGWSGGSAVQSTVAGATVSFTFTGTSVRWLSSRGREGGIALVRVDGGPGKEVDLFARPNDEFSTPATTIYGLTPGQHTLTIEVTGRQNPAARSSEVVVDAFEVEPQIVSHFQEDDPDVSFGAGWAQADTKFSWSGSGAGNAGEPVVGAKVAETANATVTVNFRGTSITWRGYKGPDAGMASVQVDGGAPTTVDTYDDTFRIQAAVFTATGLADTNHTLTITATGQKRDKATAAKIFVDAFDVTTPGRRYEASRAPEGDPSITYVGSWTRNDARVWSEGTAATSPQTGATATFTFTGTSVSWIGCQKSTIGKAKVSIDGGPAEEINMNKPVGIEAFQRAVYRKDGLTDGVHTLQIEVTSTNGNFVVVDAFDVHPSP